jgi:hypothetical protein
MVSQGHSPNTTSLMRLLKVAFFDAQDAENDFALLFKTLKHRFIDFTQVVF